MDAWLGWFGILPEFRKKGYGSIVFDETVSLAKQKGYKSFRLYSEEYFTDAHRLYRSKGMISEIYNNIDDKDPYEPDVTTLIFSMSLTDEKIELWNNKILGLKEQGIKERE